MPIHVISTHLTSTFGITADEVIYLPTGVYATASTAFIGQNDGDMQITIHGTVLATGNAAVLGQDATVAGGLDVVIGQTGSVHSTDGYAFTVSRSFSTITNYGLISATNETAIRFLGGSRDNRVDNAGTITGLTEAIFIDGTISQDQTGANITNSGTIVSTHPSQASYTIYSPRANVVIDNSGVIRGYNGIFAQAGNAGSTIFNAGDIEAFGHNAIRLGDWIDSINNSGQISGNIYTYNGGDWVLNTGSIAGWVDLGEGHDTFRNVGGVVVGDVFAGNGDDTIINTGTIVGSVDLGDRHDIYRSVGGTVTGQILGGGGDDTYYIDSPNQNLQELQNAGTDHVYATGVSHKLAAHFENLTLLGADDSNGFGNELANTLTGNDGNNRMGGRGGNDTIAGGGGADTLMGGTGNDSVNGEDSNDRISLGTGNDEGNGGNGNDFVQGMLGNDLVIGGNGDDTLLGNQGTDTLRGGNGDDLLIGGTGRDAMAGGNGADVFLFRLQGDSKIGSHDRIYDFDVTEDRLDLSALGVRDINLLSTFSHGGAPSVRTTEVGGSTQIFIDLDGLGGAEMRIDLSGTTGLGVEDFIL